MKTYVVIGGSSGIGKSLVEQLTGQGNEVYSTYNQGEAPFGTEAVFKALDVLDENLDFEHLPDVVDGLVYCPGAVNLKPFARTKDSDFLEDYQLQVIGAIKVIRMLLPRLKKSEGASVVLFSTVAVQTGFNFHSIVSASKGAIEGLVRALSAELAPKIRVNAIAPSLTKTRLAEKFINSEKKIEAQENLNPLKKLGEPDEIAALAKFLLSEEASWMTGQIIHADGGQGVIR